jgi:hypothetical protein
MHLLTTYFNSLLSRIEPDPDHRETAQDLPQTIRDHLKQTALLKTVDPHTRLAGSYARETATHNIKDVDALVFVDRVYRTDIPELLRDLKRALAGLPETLNDLGEIQIRNQRRSVNVTLVSHDLSVDVVPVLILPDKTHTDILEIPDREWLRWVKTCPLGYGTALSSLNQIHAGKAVPLIKLLKHWREVHFQRNRPKSYWLECMVYEHLDQGWVTTNGRGYAPIVADLFASLYDKLLPVLEEENEEKERVPYIPDPMLSNHVAYNWRRSAFQSFMNRLKASKRWAREAVETDGRERAVALWKLVFGDDWFPSEDDITRSAEAFGTAALSGTAWVAQTGQVLVERPAVRSVQAPPTRFFGKQPR